MPKQTFEQQEIQKILEREKCSLTEAWKIYRQKYEDVELDPAVVTR